MIPSFGSAKGLSAVVVHAEHLAQQLGAVLRVADDRRVSGALVVEVAAVTPARVQLAVRPEGQVAAVVVGLRVRHRAEDHDAAAGIGLGRSGRRAEHRVALDDLGTAGDARVVDVEEAVVQEVGVEGQAEQALLVAAGLHLGRREVEEGRLLHHAVEHDVDVGLLLLDHEEAVGIGLAGRLAHPHGAREAAREADGADRRGLREGGCCKHARHEEREGMAMPHGELLSRGTRGRTCRTASGAVLHPRGVIRRRADRGSGRLYHWCFTCSGASAAHGPTTIPGTTPAGWSGMRSARPATAGRSSSRLLLLALSSFRDP